VLGGGLMTKQKYEVKFTIECNEDDDIQWNHLAEELQAYFNSYSNSISVKWSYYNINRI